jgi:hypothetical protein
LVDQITIQTIGVLVAAASVVAFVVNSILTSRREEKRSQQNNETRQAQLYMQILNQFDSLEYQKTWVEVMSWEWKDPQDFTDRIWADKDNKAKMMYMGMLLEGVGVAVKKKLIDIHLIDDLFSIWVIGYWEKYGSVELYFRERYNAPQNAEWTEYLYDEVVKVVKDQHPSIMGKARSMVDPFQVRTA